MKYLPFLSGTYSTAPGLTALAKQVDETDKLVFQIDSFYDNYLENKAACRRENILKYYGEHQFEHKTAACITQYIAVQLQKEYPAWFDYDETGRHCILINLRSGELIQWDKNTLELTGDKYISLFDALCSQVQEDVAICQLQGDKDWLAAIHLCAPNHWAAGEKTGRPFDAIHAPVPGMEKTLGQYFKMLQSIVLKGPFTRYAWGIATDNRLNHHPQPPPGIDPASWRGRDVADGARLYIRTERQNLVGFPDVNAFLFTIRTYFYEVALLENYEKKALWSAIRSMSPGALAYKGLTRVTGFLAKSLFDD